MAYLVPGRKRMSYGGFSLRKIYAADEWQFLRANRNYFPADCRIYRDGINTYVILLSS